MKRLLRPALSLLSLFLVAAPPALQAQTAPPLGLRERTPHVYAFTHARIVTAPGQVLEDATLVIRDGVIEAVGKGAAVPKDAVVQDLQGYTLYPGFVEAWSSYGLEKPARGGGGRGGGGGPQYETQTPGPYHWNQAVKPEFRAETAFTPEAKTAGKLRSAGFTSAHVVPNDGVFRGNSLLTSTGEGDIHDLLRMQEAASCMSFNKGSSRQEYPSSLMGSIALIRQTLYDADWYAKARAAYAANPSQKAPELNLSLEAWNRARSLKLPIFFESGDWQNALRVSRIAQEFGLKFFLKTNGDEYRRPDAILAAGVIPIIPLKFPKAFEATDLADIREVPLARMRDWERAPLNPGMLARAKVPFAITADGFDRPDEFWAALHKALAHGLSPEDALAALTLNPARMLGAENRVGKLEKGFQADFLVVRGDLFTEKDAVIYETWVSGKKYVQKERPQWNPYGEWTFRSGSETWNLNIAGSRSKPTARAILGTDTLTVDLTVEGWNLRAQVKQPGSKTEDRYLLQGIYAQGLLTGTGERPDGNRFGWSATRSKEGSPTEKPKKIEPVDLTKIPDPGFPYTAYGQTTPPPQQEILIRNATVWTNTRRGVLTQTDVRVVNGKIRDIGPSLNAGSAYVVDGTGMHLTPGIIDEHSHIAISRGVNEGSHNVSAEVSIGDVLDCEDVNIYRQLSGGVTACQLLHGSANPIGGRSAIIKLRWGSIPEDLKFAAAPGFIKFALGENVKQTNWGDNYTSRYPQSRQGVEQVIRDAFQAAKDYRAEMEAWNKAKNPNLIPPRRNLQLEVLLEILDGKRHITCHSYVQSEIVMLMRIAEDMGFRINTFTHILEGYKVADKMKAHGANASTFSDWWAYKFEVYDAIPYNAALMHRVGLNVCINSDDVEMARRLNQEAGKAVLYGGISEEEALKMVTLNPAKALHIDDHVGSIDAGKDADLVLWTAPPLSVYAKVSHTLVDGRILYDAQTDQRLRDFNRTERVRLLKKMKESSEEKGGVPGMPGHRDDHCDTMENDYNLETVYEN